MPIVACDARVILVSIGVYNAADNHVGVIQYDLGTPVSFSWEETKLDVPVRAGGVTGPTCRGVIGYDRVIVCEFLEAEPVPPDTGLYDIKLVTKDGSGATVTEWFDNFMARGFTHEFTRDAPPAKYRQRFVLMES
jgi:hypothetical protein